MKTDGTDIGDGELIAGYDRSFSEIKGIQAAYDLQYCLYRCGAEMCLEVRDSRCAEQASRFMLKGMQDNFAAGLLQFLYENAVPMESARDIAQDLYEQICCIH